MKSLKIILQSKYLYIILLVFSIIYVLISTCFIKYNSIYTNETNISGTIINYKIDGNKLSVLLKSNENIQATYYIKTYDEKQYLQDNIKYGSIISINGTLSDPINNTIPNTFNYKNYLYNKRIYKLFNINSLTINNDNISIIDKVKNYIIKRLDNINNREYIKTFILGDKTDIDETSYNTFKTLGITHLMAISGMHITLLSSIILFILKKLKRKKNLSIIISLILLFLYSLLIGFPSSIRRAYILYLLLSLNNIFNLNIKTIYLLFLTIFINIIIEPFIIYDIGFLYSSTTTLGLIISNKFINKGNYFTKLFKVSLIAYLFSLPITINNNYYINLLTPINNIVIVPLVSLIIYPLSLLTFIFPFLSIILNIFINLLLFISNILLNINIFNITIPKLSIIIIIIYYILLLLFVYKKIFVIGIMLLLLITKYLYIFDDSLYVYYLDVKQGDSELIINKNETIMIDTGGIVKYKEDSWKEKNSNYNLIDNTILFLRSLGIDSINKLIITHGDYDHMGEAINLVENFKVEKVIFNCGEFNDLEQELIKVLDRKKIKYYLCIKELNIDNNKLYFLQTKEYDNENDNSNVIYTELNGYKFMFMGDAGVEKEKNILSKYNLSNIDVLKVGHHGSKTSSGKEFIDEINPKYSIISVGKNNRYGHPNKEVINNLEKSKIYRTDQDGSIMFKIKNNKLRIETCSP